MVNKFKEKLHSKSNQKLATTDTVSDLQWKRGSKRSGPATFPKSTSIDNLKAWGRKDGQINLSN